MARGDSVNVRRLVDIGAPGEGPAVSIYMPVEGVGDGAKRDALRLRSTSLEQTPSQKQADRGSVKFSWEALNQAGEVVCIIIGRQYFRRR